MYGGPFLDGFFLDDAPAFEAWAETERRRLAEAHAKALYRLAKAARGTQQHTVEIECWRMLAVLDPLSEPAALGLVHALADAGTGPTPPAMPAPSRPWSGRSCGPGRRPTSKQ